MYRKIDINAMEKTVLMRFFRKIDQDFTPSLSHKTDLDDFGEKLLKNAKMFVSYTEDGEIKGLVAIYANNFESHYSYIPLVAVDSYFRKQGIARTLLNQAINYVRDLGNDKINCIGIHTSNPVALHLYEELGFCLKDELQNREYLEINF